VPLKSYIGLFVHTTELCS